MGKQCGGHVCGCGCFILGSFFLQYLYDDMSTCINMLSLNNYATYYHTQLAIMFSIIHHTPIGWYQGTVHLVRSHHALFAELLGIPRADGDLTGLRIMKAINIGIGMIPAAEATLGGGKHLQVRCSQSLGGATFGITPAGNGELSLLVKATASGCTGPPRRGPAALLYLGC